MRAPIDLAAPFGDTNLTNLEVFMVGEAVFNWLTAVTRLGHTSPGATLDYATHAAELGIGVLIVRDFVAWTSGRVDKVPGCEERLRELAQNADLDGAAAKKVSALLAAS